MEEVEEQAGDDEECAEDDWQGQRSGTLCKAEESHSAGWPHEKKLRRHSWNKWDSRGCLPVLPFLNFPRALIHRLSMGHFEPEKA